MRTCRDDARIFPDVEDAGIVQLLFQPGELARELLPHRPGHLEFEQEGATGGVADNALELTEIAEMGRDGTADLADHWHLEQHPERRDAGGPAGEGARLSLRVIPVCESIASANRDVDGSLLEKLFDRHWASSGNSLVIFRKPLAQLMNDGKGNLVFKVIKGFRIRPSYCGREYQLVSNLEDAPKLDLMVVTN